MLQLEFDKLIEYDAGQVGIDLALPVNMHLLI